jgi:PEP-CTERM motif
VRVRANGAAPGACWLDIVWLFWEGTLSNKIGRNLSRGIACAAMALGMSAGFAPAAHAERFVFTLSGIFNGTSAITDTLAAGPMGVNLLTANEPFTMTGVFDTASGSLLPPIPVFNGFVDYAATSVTLTVGGVTYNVATYDGSLPGGGPGLTVAIFDTTSIFGFPGHVAAGFLQNPLADGAGIIGDWIGSTPSFPVSGLTNAEYTTADYFGVGVGSGPCPGPSAGGVCQPPGTPNNVVPIPVEGGLSLTLGNYDLNNPSNMIPENPNPFLFSATLTAVPEPSTWALLLVGFAGLAVAGSLARRKADLAA